ncbi:O-antigen ligase family protein [Butyrivibrio sp. AE2015]|uniref:O-antigen ligase family protein n=1 Tax=Butyrivibrio sp. AE2015 TaxID=1280663 RepID=UPI0003B34096|nr:hypothetical protein [Butyrivibrio sp. AE2015]
MKMIQKIKQIDLNILDILLFLSLLLQDVGTWGFLPLNAFQILILLMGLVMGVQIILGKKKIVVPYKVLIILAYMGLITALHYFDFEAVKYFGYTCISFCVLALYYLYEDNKEKILGIIYVVAAVLAIYGLLQEAGYMLNMPFLYFPSKLGWHRFYETEIGGGFIALYSFYGEPAHLASVFCAGILLGTHRDKETHKGYAFANPVVTALIFIATLLTGSATVYLGLLITVVAVLLNLNIANKYKIGLFTSFAVVIIAAFIVLDDLYQKIIVDRFLGLAKEYYIVGNATVYAIISNLRVAIAKMMQGHIFGTGFDSHRYSYPQMVDQMYGAGAPYINGEDAASIFTRVFSDFGIAGLLITIVYLMKKLVDGVKANDYILITMTIVFVIQGIRDGSYTNIMLMMPFVFMLYSEHITGSQLKR